MPAIPIADKSAPMVVGMRHTKSAMRTITETLPPENVPKGWRTTTTGTKTMVNAARSMVSAISLGVF